MFEVCVVLVVVVAHRLRDVISVLLFVAMHVALFQFTQLVCVLFLLVFALSSLHGFVLAEWVLVVLWMRFLSFMATLML